MAASTSAPSITSIKTSVVSASTFHGNSTLPAAVTKAAMPVKTSQERWTTYGIGTNITKDCYNFDRTIGMTVTYKFNVTRSKYKGTGAGNDEKSRL